MLKAEHLYQPGRLLSRLVHGEDRKSTTATSSFGFALDVMTDELISNSIRWKGIYDIVTAEVVYRLLDEREHALDVGAHLGLMSIVMGLRVGCHGSVRSLEPHPEIFSLLQANANRFNSSLRCAVIQPLCAAASDIPGRQQLFQPEDWHRNTGLARLAAPNAGRVLPAVSVNCVILDSAFSDLFAPALIKLDIEGHELAALSGARKMLAGPVRDIVFEDLGSYPSPVMALLEKSGFHIFALSRFLSRPKLSSPDRKGVPRRADPNYLATRDPNRAIHRLGQSGWNVLKPLFSAAN